jgi:hypothetical protein
MRGRFQRAHRPSFRPATTRPLRGAGAPYCRDGFRRHCERLRGHLVLLDIRDLHWLEGARADVQNDLGALDPRRREPSQQILAEMQSAVGAATEPGSRANTVW